MPLVVSEADRSISTGSPEVGTPNASGSGVNTGLSPPCGATLAEFGSEQVSSSTKPRSVARVRYGGEAGDVMAATDDDRAGAAALRARDRIVDRAQGRATGRAGASPSHSAAAARSLSTR